MVRLTVNGERREVEAETNAPLVYVLRNDLGLVATRFGCGFCSSGLIVVAKALLEATPDPSESEIREALRVHVCRCGAHWRILKAIRKAAEKMR